MEILRVSVMSTWCDPQGSGRVDNSHIQISSGMHFRNTVQAFPNNGYKFVRWEIVVPELWDGAEFDGASLSAIMSQVNSDTIVWDDPEYSDGGYGITFIAHMTRQATSTGEILHGEINRPIFGRNGTILFKG